MPNINVEVDLGTIGTGIIGQTVSISGCTASSCGGTKTALSPSQYNVNDFPQVLTIPDTAVSLFLMVNSGVCSGTTQCISVTTVTPTPTVTITPTPTPTVTPTLTITPTKTITPTPGVTITPTVTPDCDFNIDVTYVAPTPTPTPTPTLTITPTYTITPTVTVSPTITPTLTSTPTPTPVTVSVYYRAAEVENADLSTTYCNNFGSGGEGYQINVPFYISDNVLTPGVTYIYTDNLLTTKLIGGWTLETPTLMAYITDVENTNALNTPTTTNTNGDLLFDGGVYKFMRVDSDGLLISLGTDSCSGGPSGPGES